MNLKLQGSKRVDRPRAGGIRGHRFKSAQHETFDIDSVEIVQNEKLEFVETLISPGKDSMLNLKSYGTQSRQR